MKTAAAKCHPPQAMRRQLLLAGSAAAVLGLPRWAQAQAWTPTKPIRLVVPFAPGGSSEIVARAVAAELGPALGGSMFVENKPGGAGTIAMVDVKNAAPDGHTLILGHIGTLAVNPFAMARQPYNVNTDFSPITLLAKVPNALAVSASLPVKNLAEFLALARSKPGQINYGSAGNGSAGHLVMEYFKMVSNTFLIHIPYRGTGPMLQDVLAGRVEATFNGFPPLVPHIKAGKLRALAVGTHKRLQSQPDVPTLHESGFKDFESSQWYGLMGPAKMPPAILQRISEQTNKVLASSAVLQRLQQDDATAGGGSPADFTKFITGEQNRWKVVVARAKIVVE
jgi:tripartite-type tricarboxylate transporter receptor subunit TctC